VNSEPQDLQEHPKMNMPLVDDLLKIAGQQRSSWHMPAHCGGHAWPAWLREQLTALDVTELPLTGDINKAEGPAGRAMELAARSFGAGLTRFITGGSSTALQIMLAFTVGRGSSVLMPRCVHQSIVHSLAILNIRPCWIESEKNLPDILRPYSLLPQISPAKVKEALCRYPECTAVILTSPDYYGICPDLSAIADLVHSHGKLLLVDEAHGAHFVFSPVLPVPAMKAGADACVQSGHKTLPVLTPGAMLHVSGAALQSGRLDTERLASLVPVFQTSSPSFMIAATLDYARAWLDQSGEQAINRQLELLDEFRSLLPTGLSCLPGLANLTPQTTFSRDPLRLVLSISNQKVFQAAPELAGQLAAHGIDIEFADLSRMVLIPSLRQKDQDWQRLTAAIRQLQPQSNSPVFDHSRAELEREWQYWLTAKPKQSLPPGEVLFGHYKLRRVKLADSAGRISARSILPYPPGIPLLWPGEQIDDLRVDFLRRLSENSISINGIDQDSISVLA
jgi:lysine decarboxylase